MKYKILWVDDRKDEFEELDYPSSLKNYIADLYFEPFVDFFESVEEAKVAIKGTKYDVIFSDYNIGMADRGDDFIAYVRAQNVNTEILFYSALENVPKLNLDRISFFNIPKPNGHPKLLEKMKSLIDLTIEKLTDLQIIRGIVMTEVSELDNLMERVIIKFFMDPNGNPYPQREHIFNELMDKFDDDYKNNLKTPDLKCSKRCSHKIRIRPITDIVGSLFFESYKKARTISKILEIVEAGHNNFLNDYKSEIIDIRNMLAHCESQMINGSEVLVTKRGEKRVFNSEEFIVIRHNILKYNKLFRTLEGELPLFAIRHPTK